MDFRNINDPTGMSQKLKAGLACFRACHIFIHYDIGICILRGFSREKSNRIVGFGINRQAKAAYDWKMLNWAIGLVSAFRMVWNYRSWFVVFKIISSGFLSDEYMNIQLNEGTNILNNQFGALHQNEMIELIYERLNLAIICLFSWSYLYWHISFMVLFSV